MSNKFKDQVEEKFEDVSNDAKKKLNESYYQGKEKAEELADKAEGHLGNMQESAQKLIEEGKKKVGEAQDYLAANADDLIKIVKEKPLVSMLVAGGVGYLLSMLARK
ncbi:MAG: hypothetical protein H2069_08465 [Legionella sp.]|nr:hypothetical protein [Legionella sp.]